MLLHIYTVIRENLYAVMIPVCLLCLLRVAVCAVELGHIRRIRETKNRFLSCRHQYTEIYGFVGLFVGCISACLMPRLWMLWVVLAVALCVVGCRLGRKRADERDAYWREVGLEMQRLNKDALETEEPLALAGTAAIIQAIEDDEKEKKEIDN